MLIHWNDSKKRSFLRGSLPYLSILLLRLRFFRDMREALRPVQAISHLAVVLAKIEKQVISGKALLFWLRDILAPVTEDSMASDCRCGKLTLIVPVGRGTSLFQVTFRVVALAKDLSMFELLLNLLWLQLSENWKCMRVLLLVFDNFFERLFVDRPSWNFLFFMSQIANVGEVLHSFASRILLAFLFFVTSHLH